MGYHTNKFDLKAQVSQGPPPWVVAWGEDITETDALQGVVATGLSIFSANPAPFVAWVEQLVQQAIISLVQSAAGAFPDAIRGQVKQMVTDIIKAAIQGRGAHEVLKQYDTVDFKAGAIRYSGKNTVAGFTVSRTWGMKPYVAFRWRGAGSPATPSPAEASYPVALYGITPAGKLNWYRHLGALADAEEGLKRWAAGGGGKEVGHGWDSYDLVFTGSDGVFYGRKPNGRLYWYRHRGWEDGTPSWTGEAQVGQGWKRFDTIFAGDEGEIYARTPSGDLYWYRHLGWHDGSASWAGDGVKIGHSFDSFDLLFSGGSGIIYARESDGDLYWYRHLGWQDGSASWASGNGKKIGQGWQTFDKLVSGGDGIIYARESAATAKLWYYRHLDGITGNGPWFNNGKGVQIGQGWAAYKQVVS